MTTQFCQWFEIPVTDMDRAQKFYEEVFGVELSRNEVNGLDMAWFPMAGPEAPGATGSLVKQEDFYTPIANGSMVYTTVADIPAALASVEAAGGKIVMEKTDIGEYGFIGAFLDTEGNRVGLHQS